MIYNGNPLQYSSLENPIERGAQQATIHGLAKSQTRLNTHSSQHVKHYGDLVKKVRESIQCKRCRFRNISALRSYYHVLFNGMNEKRNKICKSVVYFSSLCSSSTSPPFPSFLSLSLRLPLPLSLHLSCPKSTNFSCMCEILFFLSMTSVAA